MTLGERIRSCRQRAGLSQERLAELVGVSRQAVTKWEADQSAPHTETLFRLAGIFGTSVDLLLSSPEDGPSPVEPLRRLRQMEEEKAAKRRQSRRRGIQTALLVCAGYGLVYLMGRAVWCDLSQTSLAGWLLTAKPSGPHSYLYGWLLSSRLFWCAMAVSVLPALFGRRRFPWAALGGFVLGLLLGIALGPTPQGAAWGQGDLGWAVWGGVFLLAILAGVLLECFPGRGHPPAPGQGTGPAAEGP